MLNVLLFGLFLHSAFVGCADERQVLIDQGAAAGQQGDLDAAEAAFTRLLEKNPGDGVAHVNLGSVFMDRANLAMAAGNEKEAEAAAERALVHFDRAVEGSPPGPSYALVLAGRVLFGLQRLRPAHERLSRFLESGDGDSAQQAEARHLIARVDHLSRFTEATSLLMPVINLAERTVDEGPEREKALRRGIELLESFVKDEPDNWSAHWFIGKAYQALGQREQAVAAFETAYRIRPDHIDVGTELAIEALQAGQFARSVEVNRAILARAPAHQGVRANLALSLLLTNDVPAAVTEITVAHDAAPDDEITSRLHTLILAVRDGKQPRPETAAAVRSAMGG